MMERGLVELVQGDASVSALCAVGGFNEQLPEGQALPSWSYTVISEPVDYLLTGSDGLVATRVQIDCYGRRPAEVQALARAIDSVLSGYQGTLSDPDSTRVAGIFRENKIDFFDASSRTPRRMLEYLVWNYQQ